MFPAAPRPSAAQPRPGSGKKLAIAALVVIGGIVAIAVVAGGGGSKGSDASGDDPASARSARDEAAWSKFRDEMCACHDRACATSVLDEIDKYVNGNEGQPDPRPTAKLKAIMKEQEKCVQRIVSGGKAHEEELPSDDVMVQEIENLRDRTCACRDKECARDAADVLADWGKQYQPTFEKQPADSRAKALAAVQAQNKCYDKIMGK